MISLAQSLLTTTLFTALLVLILIANEAKAGFKATLTYHTFLYFLIFGLGNNVATLFAIPQVNQFGLPPNLLFMEPYIAAFLGVFAFHGVLSNTNISLFDRNVLTIDSWISKARDNAIQQVARKQGEIRLNEVDNFAKQLAAIDEQVLNTYIANYLDHGADYYDDEAKKTNSDKKLYKALMLASRLPRAQLKSILKNYS